MSLFFNKTHFSRKKGVRTKVFVSLMALLQYEDLLCDFRIEYFPKPFDKLLGLINVNISCFVGRNAMFNALVSTIL